MRRQLILALVVAVAGASVGGLSMHAIAAPEPSIIPVSWELTFKHGPIERMEMTIGGAKRVFWYMRYTVINDSGKDILFTPEFELSTDTGQVIESFKDVPNEVYTKLKDLYKDPLMMSPTGILGKLLQGADNAKDGVIIFTAPEKEARDYQVFVSGLSGETAQVDNPVTHKAAVLQKTLVLDYLVPGEAIGIKPQPQLKSVKWVMK